jgi:CubicO group peptidase (beta-lactamase class C family)
MSSTMAPGSFSRRQFLGVGAALGIGGWHAARAFAQGGPAGKRSAAQLDSPETEPIRADEQCSRVLAPVLDKHHLPGMIGAILIGDRVASIGAVGIRKIGAEGKMQVEDQVHLGSCTKAMTATLIGMLVDEGKLAWDATIRDVLSQVAEKMHADFRGVTIAQLLAHRAGLPHDGPRPWRFRHWGTPTEQRRAAVQEALAEPPLSKPGTKYEYSNLSYEVAGLMAEQAAGRSYEELMRARLFEPLGMTSAGFGPVGQPSGTDQAWGHRDEGGEVRPVYFDNPPFMAPACTGHATIPDWAKFAALHMGTSKDAAGLLKAATLRSLHTPSFGGDYAGGWFVCERSWAGGAALTHQGSNTTWYVDIWVAPARRAAYLVATNQGGDTAKDAVNEAIEALIRYHDYAQALGPAQRPAAAKSKTRTRKPSRSSSKSTKP